MKKLFVLVNYHFSALDVAAGMNFLEQKEIVHRDLALRNLYVRFTDQIQLRFCNDDDKFIL